MSILTSREFCEKFNMSSRIERQIKHYEYRNEMDDIVVAYDKDEQDLWHENTELCTLAKNIKTMQKELARMEKKDESEKYSTSN